MVIFLLYYMPINIKWLNMAKLFATQMDIGIMIAKQMAALS